jgi:hypothetical protein
MRIMQVPRSDVILDIHEFELAAKWTNNRRGLDVLEIDRSE